VAFDRVVCPVCDGEEFDPLTDQPPAAGRCRGCGLGIEYVLSTDPMAGYARGRYDALRDAGCGVPTWARFHHDTAVAVDRLRQLTPHLPAAPAGGRWIDVGCGNGAMLALLRRRGWRPYGVEADLGSAHELQAVHGFPVIPYGTWLAAADAERGDKDGLRKVAAVVSFFDTLEHLLDPVAAVRTARSFTQPGGLIVVEAPDLDGVPPQEFDAWKHRRKNRDAGEAGQTFTEHVWHFCERSVTTLLRRHYRATAVRVSRPVPGRFQAVAVCPADGG
jgi:SAM-dependent methyltransferase